jgi:hypothetical protein
MTTSDQAYVWVWLTGHAEPVVAGVLERRGDLITYAYGRSYRARDDAAACSMLARRPRASWPPAATGV